MGIENIQNSIAELLDPPKDCKPTIFPIKGLPSETRGLVNEHFGYEYNPEKWDDLLVLGQTMGCNLFNRDRLFKKLIWETFTGCLSLPPLESYRRQKICTRCESCVFGSTNPESWELRENNPKNNPNPKYPNPLVSALKQEVQQILQLKDEEKNIQNLIMMQSNFLCGQIESLHL